MEEELTTMAMGEDGEDNLPPSQITLAIGEEDHD